MGKGWCILDNLLEESKLGVAAVRNKHTITGAYEQMHSAYMSIDKTVDEIIRELFVLRPEFGPGPNRKLHQRFLMVDRVLHFMYARVYTLISSTSTRLIPLHQSRPSFRTWQRSCLRRLKTGITSARLGGGMTTLFGMICMTKVRRCHVY
jgi:hypothetical protein